MSILDRMRRDNGEKAKKRDDEHREDRAEKDGVSGIVMDAERVQEGLATLMSYKASKSLFDQKVVDNYRWFRDQRTAPRVESTDLKIPQGSAWAFNAIANKHADAMDAYPEATFLPVEESDSDTADMLNTVVPALLSRSNWHKNYSDGWWEKLIAGSACYACLFDKDKDGIGEIVLNQVPILNVFWEPGVRDIQEGENFFNVRLVNNDLLCRDFPIMKGNTGTSGLVLEYANDVTGNDQQNKTEVVDWYYKVKNSKGQIVIQYCQFANGICLYSSEDAKDENGNYRYRETGYYQGGLFPFVIDNDYNEMGTPYGFSDLDLMRPTQIRINELQAAITQSAMMSAEPRYFMNKNGKINVKDFADWKKPIIIVDGLQDLSQQLQKIPTPSVPAGATNLLQAFIVELKETAGNRDFNAGGTTGGVTAASAINSLIQEGNKLSRDKNQASYNCFKHLCRMIIDRMRQFYTMPRIFRIVAPNGAMEWRRFDNSTLVPMQTKMEDGSIMERVPDFDITVEASKHSPFSRMQQNELMLQLYHEGVFNPQNADQAQMLLSGMVFDGKEQIVQMVNEGQTMAKTIQEQQAMIDRMASMLGYGQQGAQNALQAPQAIGAPMGVPTAENATGNVTDALTAAQNDTAASAGGQTARSMLQTRDRRTMQELAESAEGLV